jgi:hypothetical protein
MIRNGRRLTPQQLVFIALFTAPFLIGACSPSFSAPMTWRTPDRSASVHGCPGPGACIFPPDHVTKAKRRGAIILISQPGRRNNRF